jgi:hypothetical protein
MSELVPSKPLTQQQTNFLVQCGLEGDWHVAADQVGATRRQVRAWFSNPAFKQKYDDLFNTDELKTTMRELEMASGELGALYADAMQAEMSKKVMVDCPNCQHKFPVFVKVMDWATKLRAGETLLKVTRLWKDEKTVKNEHKGTVAHVEMSLSEWSALKRLEMGLSIPPHIRKILEDKGFLDATGHVKIGETIDGESRLVE